MTADSVRAWVEGLMEECTRWPIVFLHLGEAFPASRQEVLNAVPDVVSVQDYIDAASGAVSVRLIMDVESVAVAGGVSLGQLRERVFADCDLGTRVLLLSRSPRIVFPDVPGSSLLRDAKIVLPPVYVSSTGEQGAFGVEAVRMGTPVDVVLARALNGLGAAACASISIALRDNATKDEEGISALTDAEQEALLTSGIAVRIGSDIEWIDKYTLAGLDDALADAVARIKEPQAGFVDVSTSVWVIERLIKQALRARAISLWGASWRAELISGNHLGIVLERSSLSLGSESEGISDVSNPLDWLTLAESLELRNATLVGTLGLPEAYWAKLAVEIVPIKDRVSRSQLLRTQDAVVSKKWLALLERKLATSGSRSIDEVLKLTPQTQRQVIGSLQQALMVNPSFSGDVERDVMSFVIATIRFMAHVIDSRPAFTHAFTDKGDAPLEKVFQEAYKMSLDMSDLAGRAAIEVSSIAGGRADVVLYLNNGSRYVTEVKREFKSATREHLESSYLPQAVAYQSANVPIGHLLVLDLTPGGKVEDERIHNRIWVAHKKDDDGLVVSSTLVTVVKGNRDVPSARVA